jgi:hypothetical protein
MTRPALGTLDTTAMSGVGEPAGPTTGVALGAEAGLPAGPRLGVVVTDGATVCDANAVVDGPACGIADRATVGCGVGLREAMLDAGGDATAASEGPADGSSMVSVAAEFADGDTAAGFSDALVALQPEVMRTTTSASRRPSQPGITETFW